MQMNERVAMWLTSMWYFSLNITAMKMQIFMVQLFLLSSHDHVKLIFKLWKFIMILFSCNSIVYDYQRGMVCAQPHSHAGPHTLNLISIILLTGKLTNMCRYNHNVTVYDRMKNFLRNSFGFCYWCSLSILVSHQWQRHWRQRWRQSKGIHY